MSTPHQIAQQRLAAGEITLEQFNSIIAGLGTVSTSSQTQIGWRWYEPAHILQMLQWAMGIYAGYVVLSILVVLGTSSSVDVYNFYTYNTAGFNSTLGVLMLIGIVLELGLTIIVLVGFYRYASNVATSGISKPQCSPGWTVGWFFIPIAWFWMPYVTLSFQSRASLYGHDWDQYTPPAALLIWFLLFWLVQLAAIGMGELGPDATNGIASIGIALGILTIASLVCLHSVFQAITRAQSQWKKDQTQP